ncbi:hypothetical protein R5R35_002908 [Gryllus longicercus]|uniref:Uncharacterized protein n=1 Tax=Gryllus longicercus TaxID=2509291 RepID=A0AAN9VZ77_9ORTH
MGQRAPDEPRQGGRVTEILHIFKIMFTNITLINYFDDHLKTLYFRRKYIPSGRHNIARSVSTFRIPRRRRDGCHENSCNIRETTKQVTRNPLDYLKTRNAKISGMRASALEYEHSRPPTRRTRAVKRMQRL